MKMRNIIVLLTALITLVFLGVDYLHFGSNDTQTFFAESILGSVFAAQTVAVICAALLAVAVPGYKSARLWLGCLAIAVVTVVVGAATFYNNGPRITTEADGPASVGYYCKLGELYSTTDSEALCFFKNQPLAVSNIVGSKLSFTSSNFLPSLRQIISFIILEAAIGALTVSGIRIVSLVRRNTDKIAG